MASWQDGTTGSRCPLLVKVVAKTAGWWTGKQTRNVMDYLQSVVDKFGILANGRTLSIPILDVFCQEVI